jgi:hypothetical protein
VGPEAVQKDVSSVIFAYGLCAGVAGWTSVHFFCRTTWANQGFVANGRRGERFSSQVYQLISDFFMAKYHWYSFKKQLVWYTYHVTMT